MGLEHFAMIAAKHHYGAFVYSIWQFGQAVQHPTKLFVQLLSS